MRKHRLLPVFVVILVGGLWAQTPSAADAPQSFEVATVKQNTSGTQFSQLGGPPGRFTATNVPLRQLITVAYQLQGFQIDGGPSWLGSDRFDIVAKTDGTALTLLGPSGPPSPVHMMLRTLLAERFKLVVHTATKEMPIYALVLARPDAKFGPQLQKSTADCDFAAAPPGRGTPGPPPMDAKGRPLCGMRGGPASLSASGFPLSQLARSLSGTLQRVVVDRTGLTGTFDFNLTWTPDQMPQRQGGGDGPIQVNGVPIDPNGPSLFTAVQEQLGLRLESTRAPVEMLIIDRAEKPAED